MNVLTKRFSKQAIHALLAMLLISPLFARAATSPSLQSALDLLEVPPAWFATTPIRWDTNQPWKDARLEIRRLLGLDDGSVRQGVKLTWLYSQKNDIGDGHELPMYLFMSGNYAWAAQEYPKYLARVGGKGATHGYLCYASCLAHFSEYKQALEVLDKAINDLPAPPWRISSTANVHNHYGDVYVQMGLAVLDTDACLPHRGERDCQLCFDECNAAGYRAIEMQPIQLPTGPVPEGMFSPEEIEQMSRILAPFVNAEACVGCGLCEYRCHSAWVVQQQLLNDSAVLVQAPNRLPS